MLAIRRAIVSTATIRTAQRGIAIPSTSIDELDAHILSTAHRLLPSRPTALHHIVEQYHDRAGLVLDRVMPYQAYPPLASRADAIDGVVMIAHVALDSNGLLGKLVVCSGFAVQTEGECEHDGDVIISCGHTLDEVHRDLRKDATATMSIVFPSHGPPRAVSNILTSLPRRDLVVLQTESTAGMSPIPTLPVSPYALSHRHPLLGHVVSSPTVPALRYNKGDLGERIPASVENPTRWVQELGWRRWGRCEMLGYRDGRGREVERGTSEPLPYLLTSLLPTPGSSGGPIIDAIHGSVVGVFSGTRMDNWVEGERGWGATGEGIFEMFSLPGFKPASLSRK